MVFVVSILDDDDDSVPKRFFSGMLLAWLFRKDGKEDATALRRSINTSRERESFSADFSVFFSFFFRQNDTFSSWKKQITLKIRERRRRRRRRSFCRRLLRRKAKSVKMPGARTRAQKRRIGQRDSLWDLIVKNDDICFTHILPRLNSTDIKFLYLSLIHI